MVMDESAAAVEGEQNEEGAEVETPTNNSNSNTFKIKSTKGAVVYD